MKLLITAIACFLIVALTAQEQVITYPYNPDIDTDSLINTTDLLEFVTIFGDEFIPEPILVDGVNIYELLLTINNTIEEQQEEIEYLQSVINQGGDSGALPVGSIIPFAGEEVPEGWLLCDGTAVNTLDYSTLHNLIGSIYGEGDGSYTLVWIDENEDGIIQPEEMFEVPSTFSLPDLRGKVPVGKDDMGGNAAGIVLNNGDTLGNSGGEEMHTLTEDEMPSHSHDVPKSGNVGPQAPGLLSIANFTSPYAVSYAGGDQPHNNMQPYLITNYIIKY